VSTELANAGFVLVQSVVDDQRRQDLLRSIDAGLTAGSALHRRGNPFAARGLLWKVPKLTALLESCGLTAIASQLLGTPAFPIDATYFVKHARANWTVPGHQDRILPVDDGSPRKDRIRGGIAYAEPDAHTLAQLVALRLHFDRTDADTGALGVVPASHLGGILTTVQILDIPIGRYIHCPAAPGDVLAMRPLLLHRSSPSRAEGQRRVMHVVYAAGDPDDGIRWRRSAQQGVAALVAASTTKKQGIPGPQ
jgi:Phytanoyl-CoA dioxygenase (PhyH)